MLWEGIGVTPVYICSIIYNTKCLKVSEYSSRTEYKLLKFTEIGEEKMAENYQSSQIQKEMHLSS